MGANIKIEGGVIPTKEKVSTAVGVVRCPECHHEFIKLVDESDFMMQSLKGVPFKIIVQLVANILVGVVLWKANSYLLPEKGFSDPVSLIYSLSLILPSAVLFLALFAVQYMGLIRVWFFMAVGVIGMGAIMWGGVAYVDFIREYLPLECTYHLSK